MEKLSYNTSELSALTGMSAQKIRRLVRLGKLPVVQIPGTRGWLYRAKDVQDLLDNNNKVKDVGFKKGECVYLIKSGKYYKIGRTTDINNRLKALGGHNPNSLNVVTLIYTNNYIGLEKELHKKYADKNKHGEWYTLTKDEVKEIKANAKTI